MKQKQNQKDTPITKKPQLRKKKAVIPQNTPNLPAPEYEIPVKPENIKLPSFSRIIPHEPILEALKKASYEVPSPLLMEVLPAVLRGSDTLIFKSKQPDGSLIGTIPAVSKLVDSGDIQKIPHGPIALFLFESQESLKSVFLLTQEIFPDFKNSFGYLSPTSELQNDENQKKSQSAHILFATPSSLLRGCVQFENNPVIPRLDRGIQDLKKPMDPAVKPRNDTNCQQPLNLSHIKLLCLYELNRFEGADRDALNLCMDSFINEKIQKIFISHQNTPKIREFTFKYLEDPEIFAFLPAFVTEQYPRQYAHALESTKKFQVLLGYLKTFKPRAALVIANTRTVAEWIAFKLHGNSIKVSLLTAPLSPYQKRIKLLNSAASGEIHVFVCTDLALKNFGVEHLNCIYHFDLPDNPNLYLERLNKIERSRNPISIAFICEDYGFNMKKIEEILGFKIRLTIPDKNFFEFKDTSAYPLESNGRVKSIGHIKETEEPIPLKDEVKIVPLKDETKFVPLKEEAKIVPRKEEPKTIAHKHIEPQTIKTTAKLSSRHHQPDTSKFIRRDDRAREALADALIAAKMAEEKRKSTSSQKSQSTQETTQNNTNTEKHNVFSSFLFVVSEALRAGAHATKESLAQNTAKRFPALHRFFKSFKE